MTLKKTARAVGAALIYFGIYIAWQFVVMYWAMFGATLVMSIDAGADMAQQMASAGTDYSYEDVLDASLLLEEELVPLVTDWVLDHAAHLTVISGVLTLITYAVLFKIRKKKLTREIGLSRMPISSCACMILLGAALNLAVSFVLPLIPFPESWWTDYAVQSEALLGAEPWITVLLSVILAPILEEVVFRGLIYTRIKSGMPMFAAMIISAWLFGLMHGAMIAFIYAALLGFVLVWTFEKCGSLTAPLLLHFGFNACAMLIGEFADIPVAVCIASILVSAALIAYVQLTSKNKIEFTI